MVFIYGERSMVTIDRYFRPKESDLPSANKVILKIIPFSSIKLANQMVSKVIAKDEATSSL